MMTKDTMTVNTIDENVSLSSCYDDLVGTRRQGYSATGLRAQGGQVIQARTPLLKLPRDTMRMATWNIRTLLPLGKPELVCRALNRYDIDIC